MVSTLGFKKFTKKPANGLTIASYWGCWPTGGLRRVGCLPCASPRGGPLGSAMSFCSEIWSSAELNNY